MSKDEYLICLLLSGTALAGVFQLTHSWLAVLFAVQGIIPLIIIMVLLFSCSFNRWHQVRYQTNKPVSANMTA